MSGDEISARAQHRVGTTIRGKYRVDSVLGIGGMAVVYAATHRNQARFAVKMLHPELSIREDITRRFLREGYVANSVRHPGAVAVVDDDVAEDGAAFLVMELLDGMGVEQLWERYGGHVPLPIALAVVEQLLDVLAAAHEKSIVHRDIKPANIFVTKDGVLKVLDFGIARLRDAMTNDQATQTGMTLGTPAFMAPEQALAKASSIDGLTDVWAAGATLFTLVSGELVHEGENGQQILIRAATAPARSLALVAPETPRAVVDLVARALAFEKSERWQSAAAMRAAVLEELNVLGGGAGSREILAGCFASDKARELAIAPTDLGPSKPATRPALSQTGPTRAAPAAVVAAASIPRLIGGTTAQPLTDDLVSAGLAKKPRSPAIIGALVLAAVGIAVGGAFLYGKSTNVSVSANAASGLVAAPSSAATAPAVATPPLTAASSTTEGAPPAIPPSAIASTASAPPTPQVAKVVPPTPVPPRGPAPTPPASVPSRAPAVPPPSCDPPYTIDNSTGVAIKKFKRDCPQ